MKTCKLISLLLAAALLLGLLAACGGPQTPDPTQSPAVPSEPAAPSEPVPSESEPAEELEPEVPAESVLTGAKNYVAEKEIFYLGADYFCGQGKTFAEFLAGTENGTCRIDAVAGSVMAGASDDGYVQRVKALEAGENRVLVVELTDNDLKQSYELGVVDYSYDETQYDTNTILGALNYVFKTARDLQMPAVLFLPVSEQPDYAALCEGARLLQEKWGFGIVDLSKKDADANVYAYAATELNSYLLAIRANYEKMFQYAGNLPQFAVDTCETDPNSPLKDLHIVYLGSSVTLGFASENESFADYIAKRTGNTYVKEAANGTSLCNFGPGASRSYVERLKANLDPNEPADLFIVQLSTNDVTKGAPLGEISPSKNPEDFDLGTIAGAMEFIITYVQQTWDCPVMFYTGTDFGEVAYLDMINLLYALQDKYGVGVIDLYHNLSIDIPEYSQYMSDSIHPTKRGYKEWWTPYMEDCIAQFMSNR